ncbi:MAG: flagellar biosynthesis anti-sigma factor FlgM [Lachnospiraceae bacterium]|nr:flagellar biosynthesis anti-sigma factor FlgM [Lachnospiraceae bacterium]
MRIEAYNQIQQIYGAQKVRNTTKTGSASFSDSLQISQTGKDIQTAKAALARTADVRTALVDRVRQSLENGTYNVSPDQFADKILGSNN